MRHLKQEFDKLTFKEAVLYGIGLLTLIAAFVLLFMALLMPPEGEIHDSVLTAYGLSLLFVAAIFGISAYFVSSLTGFKRAILEILEKHEVDTKSITENNKTITNHSTD